MQQDPTRTSLQIDSLPCSGLLLQSLHWNSATLITVIQIVIIYDSLIKLNISFLYSEGNAQTSRSVEGDSKMAFQIQLLPWSELYPYCNHHICILEMSKSFVLYTHNDTGKSAFPCCVIQWEEHCSHNSITVTNISIILGSLIRLNVTFILLRRQWSHQKFHAGWFKENSISVVETRKTSLSMLRYPKGTTCQI